MRFSPFKVRLDETVAFLSLSTGLACVLFAFSVLKPALTESFPYPEPERLAMVRLQTESTENYFSPYMYVTLEKTNRAWQSLAAMQRLEYFYQGRLYDGVRVTSNWFHLWGANPFLGRLFAKEEDFSSDHVLVVSHAFWEGTLGGATDLSSLRVRMGETDYRVVGVLSEQFHPPAVVMAPETAFWAPMGGNVDWDSTTAFSLRVLGRLASQRSLEQARSEVRHLARPLVELYRKNGSRLVPRVQRLTDFSRSRMTSHLGLFGLAVVVLLAICVNLAYLGAGRLIDERRQLAIRSALGASPRDLLMLLLRRLAWRGALSGAAAIFLVYAARRGLYTQAPAGIFVSRQWHVDWYDLTALLACMTLALLMVSALTVRGVWKADDVALLSGQEQDVLPPAAGRRRWVLVALQLASAVFMAVGAIAVLRQTAELLSVDVGFGNLQALAVAVPVDPDRYQTRPAVAAYLDTARERVRALPEVSEVAVAGFLPLAGGGMATYTIGEGTELYPGTPVRISRQGVSPCFFETLGIPLRTQRDISHLKLREVIVDEAMAELFWPTQDAVGQDFAFKGAGDPYRVIGVAGAVSQDRPGSEHLPTMYVVVGTKWLATTLEIIVKARNLTPELRQNIVERIRSADPLQPIGAVRTLQEVLDGWTVNERFVSLVLSVFSLLAIGVAVSGIYAGAVFEVHNRRKEVLVRLALGARVWQVKMIFLVRTIWVGIAGSVLGLSAALAGSGVFQSFVGEAQLFDLKVWLGVPLGLVLVSLLAALAAIGGLRLSDPVSLTRTR